MRRTAIEYASDRKGQLTTIADLQKQVGIRAKLALTREILGMKIYGFLAKTFLYFNDSMSDLTASINVGNLKQVDRIVTLDVGKVGSR